MSLMPILGQLRNRRGNFNLGDPFSALTPNEIRRRMEYERNNPDEFRQTIMPVPMLRNHMARADVTPSPSAPTKFGQLQGGSGPRPPSLEEVLAERGFQMPERPRVSSQDVAFLGTDPVTGRMRQGGSTDRGYYKKLDEMYAQNPEALEIAKQYTADPSQFGGEKPTDRRAALGVQLNQSLQQEMPLRQPQPFQPQPFQPQPAPPQFGQVEEQPQFNQQGMQQMMQMMQQMMQMFSMMSGQGGFGGGFNQRPPMFGGGFGGGMGSGFGRGYESMGSPFGQMMRPRPRPMFDYFSQSPFSRY